MTPLRFWFDPISPYAYLAFERLPQVLEGCSHVVEYRPVLFAGLLKHWGQLGPAEIEPKRAWTWRQVAWLATQHGIAMQPPPRHPFNPLPLLRLLLATAPEGGWPNRLACETVLRHVWTSGEAADDSTRLATLQATLTLQRDPGGEGVKQQLRAAGDEALARGVFGVPTVEQVATGRLFWGQDALPMLRQCLQGDPWFDSHWDAAAHPVPGVVRSR